MKNFSRLSKIKFIIFLNSFISQFSFISKPISKAFWTLDSTTHCNKSNAPACMHIHVATPYDVF